MSNDSGTNAKPISGAKPSPAQLTTFDGKVAVVTGGASGIGYAIANALGKAGAKLVLADTARLAAIGLLLGVALSLIAGRIEAAALFGVSALDGLSVVVALCVLVLAVLSAAWIPARRAASVEPMEALRTG